MTKLTLLTAATLASFLTACSGKPPETTIKKEWGVNEETGQWEEQETHETTIYSSSDNDMPELKLPTEKDKKKKN